MDCDDVASDGEVSTDVAVVAGSMRSRPTVIITKASMQTAIKCAGCVVRVRILHKKQEKKAQLVMIDKRYKWHLVQSIIDSLERYYETFLENLNLNCPIYQILQGLPE